MKLNEIYNSCQKKHNLNINANSTDIRTRAEKI